jgi:hypothetical protein
MQPSDASSGNALEDGPEYFVYHDWMERVDIPEDATHVRIDSSVRAIKERAFVGRREVDHFSKLVVVILNDGLEEIGKYAFMDCFSLKVIAMPNTVRAIKDGAFRWCESLTTVTLGDGLEEIGGGAFCKCYLLEHIVIPNTVKRIRDWAFADCYNLTTVTVTLGDGLEVIESDAFYDCQSLECIVIPNNVKTIEYNAFHGCRWLTAVTLGEGLEEIGPYAFEDCYSLEQIAIPNSVKTIRYKAFKGCEELTRVTLGEGVEKIGMKAFNECICIERIAIPKSVKTIDDTAFEGCSNLTRVEFCDEIEEFVSRVAMRDWWNHGVHQRCMVTYCFLVRCGIPARFSGLALVSSWQANINDMLRGIPTVSPADVTDPDPNDWHYTGDGDVNHYDEGMNAYLDIIDAKLTAYENLLNEAPVLFPEEFGLDHGIVLDILSFL